MRVVHVSAHYPPNFVSGGTLVPQRLAQGLAERGHETYVYAGYLDDERTPLETWTENDSHGVAVRWIVTTPWVGWADRHNYDNPPVQSDFRAWLDEVRPDVVHLHSLQSLGAGLVTAAHDSGAKVVLTMHDFWWCCARQFLVDKNLRPCSLVVDCGVCQCEVDRPWLDIRNAYLRSQLKSADLILAPSSSAARVLIANGIPAERVSIDENGLPTAESAEPHMHTPKPATPKNDDKEVSTGTLRFMFAGGVDPMKGLPVLIEALRKVHSERPWSIDLYNVPTTPARVPSGVIGRPAYAPSELTTILSEHDVLVLPSVMRESHSILTREALIAGLAVICTDTLGPEEVVHHGVNGLVVPAADPASLASAMQQLIEHPETVEVLRDAPPGSIVRALSDQIDGVEELYRGLLVADAAAPHSADPVFGTPLADIPTVVNAAKKTLLKRVVFVIGCPGAPLRYRVRLPAEALALHGIQSEVFDYHDPRIVEAVRTADAVVMYRVPATRFILDVITSVQERERPIPVLFDVDDLIFDPDLRGQVHGLDSMSKADQDLWWRGVARYRTTMVACDAYIGSTDLLCAYVTDKTGLPSFKFTNGVGQLLSQASDAALRRTRADGPLRIGYFSGTTMHDEDWADVEEAIITVLQRHTEVELWLGGRINPTARLGVLGDRVRRIPHVDWGKLPGILRDLDINLAPLRLGGQFNEAKSAIKWLESALVRTPTIASPSQPFVEAIENGRTGRLARTRTEWEAALEELLTDVAERERIGAMAQREALLQYSPTLQGKRYLDILEQTTNLVRAARPQTSSTWVPVFDEEGQVVSEVEPYALNVPPPTQPTPTSRSRRLVAATVRTLRDEGPRGVVHRGTAKIRRWIGH